MYSPHARRCVIWGGGPLDTIAGRRCCAATAGARTEEMLKEPETASVYRGDCFASLSRSQRRRRSAALARERGPEPRTHTQYQIGAGWFLVSYRPVCETKLYDVS